MGFRKRDAIGAEVTRAGASSCELVGAGRVGVGVTRAGASSRVSGPVGRWLRGSTARRLPRRAAGVPPRKRRAVDRAWMGARAARAAHIFRARENARDDMGDGAPSEARGDG
jgi:hypothetical protein